jgi:hypothetical protein
MEGVNKNLRLVGFKSKKAHLILQLVSLEIWKTIKNDRKRHMPMLKEALEKEIHDPLSAISNYKKLGNTIWIHPRDLC